MGVARSSDTRCFGHGGRKKLAERLAKAGRVNSAQLIIGIGLGGVRATESIRLPRVTRRRRRGEGGEKKSGYIRGRIKKFVSRDLGWWNWINSSVRRARRGFTNRWLASRRARYRISDRLGREKPMES